MKEIGNIRLLVYEAILSNSNNIARITAARRTVEQSGGKLDIAPLQSGDMALVTLTLPAAYTPDKFFPGLPFYPSTSR